MSYIVAIVGRPNVGKSTLFNRIIGSRNAIVHDEPGVTRDRHYGKADWAGKLFTLIDTGGFVPRSEDLFEKAIREQAQIAIEEAHAVIFLVDAQSGLTPLDEEIAVILRKDARKIYLVVNKVDDAKAESSTASFFKLGLGEPFSLSALGGRKIGDFLDSITEPISADKSDGEEDTRLKLAIIGKPNVGKSSFVNAIIGKPRNIVTDIPGTTRDAIDTVLKYHQEEIILIDTAGLRRKSRVKESVEFYSTLRAIKSIERSDVVILIVDIAQGMDKQDLRIMETIIENKRGIVLAANKWDLVEKDDQTAREYEKEMKSNLRMYEYVPIVFISALEKQRVGKVIERAKEVHAEQSKRISTNKLNTLVLGDIKKTPPASVLGKEIKINYVTQVKTNPPGFSFFTNEPKHISEQYKRFLEGRLRKHFGFTGVPLSLYFRDKRKK